MGIKRQRIRKLGIKNREETKNLSDRLKVEK
jgi:hypothetical protein